MATARLTFGSVLGTVNTAATTLTSTISAAGKAIGMIDTYVSEAAEKQGIRSLADMETYVDQLISEKSEESATRKLAVLEFCGKSPVHKSLYEEAFNRYSSILRPKPVQNISAVA